VPLARIVSDRVEIFDSDFRPPAARPLARPRSGYGSTTPGGTAWQADLVSGKAVPPRAAPCLSLSVRIDTRAAGFTLPPCYFAWLQGKILYPLREVLLQDRDQQDQGLNVAALLCPSIEGANLSGFQLRVLIPGFVQNPDEEKRRIVLARAQQSLSVCWLGIQMDHDTTSSSEVHNGNP
jgi:hypothetical protein